MVFITQSNLCSSKKCYIKLYTLFYLECTNSKKKNQQVTIDISSDIVLDKFMKITKSDTKEPYLFSFNDTTLL